MNTYAGSTITTTSAGANTTYAIGDLQQYTNASYTLGSSNGVTITTQTAVTTATTSAAVNSPAITLSNTTSDGSIQFQSKGVSGSVQLQAVGNTFNLNNTGVESTLTAGQAYNYTIDGNTILNVTKNNVRVNGNLQVLGVIDSINVSQANLLVQDKEIYLAYNSNVDPLQSNTWVNDGPTNDKTGIVVQGLPSTYTQYVPGLSNEKFLGKSILWNNNGGKLVTNLGTSTTASGPNAAIEDPYWEVKGGALRITQATNVVPTTDGANNAIIGSCSNISYHFRINGFNELEIVKVSATYSNGVEGNPVYQTVSRFGKSLRL
jgi:hypothetical protein